MPRVVHRPSALFLAAGAAALLGTGAGATPASAGPITAIAPEPRVATVVPGVTYQRAAEGDQVIHVVRVRRGGGRELAPVLAGGSVQRRGALAGAVAGRANAGAVAGINGDFFNFASGNPSGLFLAGGELVSEPEAGRSSLIVGEQGIVEVARLAFSAGYQASDALGRPLAPRLISGLNRPAQRGSEAILYTPVFGAATTPAGGSVFEARVRLDQDGPLLPGQPRSGTVVARGAGGGMTIGPGHMVVAGVGSAGRTVAAELALGNGVTVSAGVDGLPAGTPGAVGGGPVLVRDGQVVGDAGEAFTAGQTDSRTSRSAVGQRADGTLLLVSLEGPSQGSDGMTVAEQAALMARLGAFQAIAFDGGGSAQLAVRDELVTAWRFPRQIASALLVRYPGVQLEPLPFRISPNDDGVDDSPSAIVRSATPGQVRVTLQRKPRGETWRLLDAPLGPGAAAARIDPSERDVPDGVYEVIARHEPADGGAATTQRRRVLIDRTLSHLRVRPTRRGGERVLDVGYRLLRPARVTVEIRSGSGRLLERLVAGERRRVSRHRVTWDRRVDGDLVSGTVTVRVLADGRLGLAGLERSVSLAPPPPPRPRPDRPG